MDLNSKSFNSNVYHAPRKGISCSSKGYFMLLERMFGAYMVHDTSVHQIFRALPKPTEEKFVS